MFAAERTVVELLAAGRELPDAEVGPNWAARSSVSADLTAELAAEPWLEPYVADGDTSLADARLRRRTAQEDYLRRSRRRPPPWPTAATSSSPASTAHPTTSHPRRRSGRGAMSAITVEATPETP